MGNFLAVLSSPVDVERAQTLFDTAHRVAQAAKQQNAAGEFHKPGCHIVAYERRGRQAMPMLVCDPRGNWLLATGTWFHKDGYGPEKTPSLLERYIKAGARALAPELEGFFAILAGNWDNHELSLITDIAGSCHAFVRDLNGIIAVSGSAFQLAAIADCDLDPTACQEFLNTGIVYEERTLYKGVRKLPPSSITTYVQGRQTQANTYWSVRDLHPNAIDPRRAPRTLADKLASAAQKISRSYPNPVCDLTGGFDSRAVLAGFLMAGVHFSTTVSGPPASPDVIISRRLAEMLGLEHLHVHPTEALTFEDLAEAFAYTDGEYDLADYARILRVHRRLASQFDVSINGSFGEVARGYWWELLWPKAGACEPADAARVARLRYAAQPFDASIYGAEVRLEMASHFTGVFTRTNAGLSGLPNTMQMDHAYLMMRMQRWQGRIGSSTDQLWPCVPPFLFRSVLETMLQTPPALRRRSLLIRRMLAECRPDLANFPLEHGNPAAPVTLTNMYRFTPLAAHYGHKILTRMKGKLGLRPAASPMVELPLRLQLWKDSRVQFLLNECGSRMNGILDGAGVTAFVNRSKDSAFPYTDQWYRLLTLSYATEQMARARKETAASRS